MDNIEELDTASPLDLIVETGMLRLDKAHLTAELAAVKAELTNAVLINEDLRDALEEAAEWVQKAPNGEQAERTERLVEQWRRLLEAAQ